MAITDEDGVEIVEYEYDEWGAVGDIYYVDEDDTDPEHILLSEINPILYRGYYDYETGYYYLQSRYYDPSICRFINADIPEIAQQSKDEVNGLNLFAYCCNDPVNNSDPTGYWGKNKHEDITYDVAKKYFTKDVAEKIAKYCRALDVDCPSTAYAKNLFVHAEEKEWQYYHFNKYKTGTNDSRDEYAAKWLAKAIKYVKGNNKEEAYKWLGYSLHCLQDKEAHGQIGRGTPVPQHVLSDNGKNLHHADHDGYEWTNSKKNALKRVMFSNKRINCSIQITDSRIISFISKTEGGWKYDKKNKRY